MEIIDNSSKFSGESRDLPNATACLVLGIISIVTCFLYAIPGLICGIIGLYLYGKDNKIYQADPSSYQHSYKNLKAGYVCSLIGTILSGLYLLAIIFLLVFIGSLNFSNFR
jgi:hypothetical protein